MANPTMVQIASQTITVAASSVTFSSIPSTYTDLVLKISARSSQVGGYSDDINLNFNGTTSAMSVKLLYGTGAAAASTGYSSQTNVWASEMPNFSATANTFGNAELYIPNYAGSTQKSYSIDSVTENNATNALALLTAGLYANTSAISTINLYCAGGLFTVNSTFYLYGINNS